MAVSGGGVGGVVRQQLHPSHVVGGSRQVPSQGMDDVSINVTMHDMEWTDYDTEHNNVWVLAKFLCQERQCVKCISCCIFFICSLTSICWRILMMQENG